ncbi:MAG: class I SAM-dependent methyltransferase [Deltaproteobacteria bacterium]|nr:MAG: class I SAM-dependent methyltransferase [Deltaproteobacteria bacterium]
MPAKPPADANPYPHARGDGSAYDRYLAGMDASMRQKVALTVAHLLGVGDLADMGMGSGTGSFALASLYPGLSVVGVDVDPGMVSRAAERYVLPNLRFIVGDIAEPCFPAGSVEAILDSSVLHHVTTFSGYDRAAAVRALAVQADQLADHGVLVVRDFLDPGPGRVWLDLPGDDGDGSDDPRRCSTAALFERFAGEFRAAREPAARGFAMAPVAPGADDPPLPAGWRRYACERVHAVEFVLRKDYRHDWELEVLEEYTYLTQPQFETTFAALGLRVLASTPIRNPWIVQHRFAGRFVLRDEGEHAPLDWPATNYVIVGQRVGPTRGVGFREEPTAEAPRDLALSHWRRLDSGVVYDVVRRPGRTVDVVPWFVADGALYVLARLGHPRPILASARAAGGTLDGSAPVTWVHEALTVRQTDKPLGQTVEERLTALAGLGPDALLRFDRGPVYYPSPGGVQEEVRAVFVEVAPTAVAAAEPGPSGLSDAGPLRAIEVRQVLRAAQVGGLPDARLELNVYAILLKGGRDVGAWIGAEIDVPEAAPPADRTTMAALAERPRRRRFRSAPAEASSGFLSVTRARFVEQAADGAAVGERTLEYVLPTRFSAVTVTVACLRRAEGQVWLGLDDDDLPASQCFDGHSELLVTPAWRLPRAVVGPRAAEAFVRARLAAEYGVRGGPLTELGGRYHPSPAVTPEVVHPFALAVTAETPAARALRWVRLEDAVTQRDRLVDGHLRVVALRAAHALGLLASAPA